MERKFLLRRIWITVLVFFALSAFSTVKAASPVDLSKAPKTITIGACFSITGKYAGLFKPMGDWENALVDVINERGGIYVKEYKTNLPIKVIWYDDKSDPTTTMKFYEKLITVDKVDLLLGATTSPQGMASAQVAEKYEIPIVLTASNDPVIFSKGFKWITSALDTGISWSKWYFEMLKKQTDAKRIAMVGEDTIFALGVRKGVQQMSKDLGLELVFDKLAPADTKDFTPMIVELKKLNPDVVYVSSFVPFLVTFTKQALQQGLRPKAFHGATGGNTSFLEAIGAKEVNYMTGEHYWVPGLRFEGWELFEEIAKRAKVNPLDFPSGPPCNFGAHQVLFKAIEIAGTLDRKKIQQTLETAKFKIMGGPWYRKPDGAGTFNPFPIQYVDGKVYALYPPDVTMRKFVYPKPW